MHYLAMWFNQQIVSKASKLQRTSSNSLVHRIVAVMFGCLLCVVDKDKPGEQMEDVEKSQDMVAAAAAADTDASAASPRQSEHQSRHQSAYGAWQTVQQDV